MLKEVSFSSALTRSAKTLLSPAFVLASINASTCSQGIHLVFSFAAGLLARFFEHATRYDCLRLYMCVIALRLCVADQTFSEWSAITGAKVLYTDNVFEFSAARRLQLSEDPSQPVIVPLSRRSDTVREPSIDLRRTSLSSLGLTEISVKTHGFIFTNNPIFNYGDYRIQVNQQVGPDSFVLLRYRYGPNLFLGPNTLRQTGNQLALKSV